MVNYRKIFEKHYNMKIPKGYDIHHIDFNRDNNNISNLLLLPSYLHQQYHNTINNYMLKDTDIITKIVDLNSPKGMINKYIKDYLDKFLPIYFLCQEWYDYKDFLDGKKFNIHNITL